MKMTMILVGILVAVFGGFSLVYCFTALQGEDVQLEAQSSTIVFEGTVLSIAPNPGTGSGAVFTIYQLAKYRVDRVCKGYYSGKEIVVDHLILSTKELEGVKVGDKICVTVQKSNRIYNRWNYPGIREESDVVDVYYIGGQVDPHANADCNCK